MTFIAHTKLSWLGAAILPTYFLLTLLIGWLAKRHKGSSNDFLNASRSLPLWIVCAAYLAANCGALEIVGLSAMSAQYGVQAFHFYWIGAIPAMVFLSLWMMPVYMRSGVHSVPEYLELRYSPAVRLLNAWVLALMMLLLAGISLYAIAQVLEAMLGWSFVLGISISASVVIAYVLLGGVRATIYNEVLQLVVMLAGLIPLALRSLSVEALHVASSDNSQSHLWQSTPLFSQQARLDSFGVVFGLGFVLSFGYWCTDFVLMQRALAARTDVAARQVPLWAGFGKLGFSFLVVLPGLAAHRLFPQLGHARPFDQALPMMMNQLFGPTMLGVGLTALVASLMSGLAANVSGFASVWTEDIYRAHLHTGQTETHYRTMGRAATIVAIGISVLASSLSFYFSNLMEHVQLIFSVFNAPFFAIFLLGMGERRITARGAFAGFLSGTGIALLHLLAVARHWIHYGSTMNSNFHAAIYAFCTTLLIGGLVSATDRSQTAIQQQHTGLIFRWKMWPPVAGDRLLWALSFILLATCLALNVIWR